MASGDSLWDNNIRFRRSLNKYFQIVANLCQVGTYIFVIDIGVGMEIHNDAPYNAILSVVLDVENSPGVRNLRWWWNIQAS